MVPIVPPAQTAQAPQAVQNPRPWYMGNGGGTTSMMRHEVQRRARLILESDEYQQTLKDRILAKDLPPAVETMLWYYAYGKPMEQVNLHLNAPAEDLSTLSTTDLMDRARKIADQLEEAKALDDAIPAEFKVA